MRVHSQLDGAVQNPQPNPLAGAQVNPPPPSVLPGRFPDTRESLVEALANNDSRARDRAFDIVIRAYRAPVIALLARKWSLTTEDAEDLAHEFFARALEKEWFLRYRSERGQFRAFLRSCLNAFASDENDRLRRKKRGGGAMHESLDGNALVPATEPALDALFEQEWIRSVLQLSLEALKADAEAARRPKAYEIFAQYDVVDLDPDARPTYAQLAARWNVPITQVTNYLSWSRKRFRQHVLDTVRSLTGSDQEYRDELRTLLGAVPE
jgi:DNA-directed RNA polymerase specialized sigma24 family protein